MRHKWSKAATSQEYTFKDIVRATQTTSQGFFSYKPWKFSRLVIWMTRSGPLLNHWRWRFKPEKPLNISQNVWFGCSARVDDGCPSSSSGKKSSILMPASAYPRRTPKTRCSKAAGKPERANRWHSKILSRVGNWRANACRYAYAPDHTVVPLLPRKLSVDWRQRPWVDRYPESLTSISDHCAMS